MKSMHAARIHGRLVEINGKLFNVGKFPSISFARSRGNSPLFDESRQLRSTFRISKESAAPGRLCGEEFSDSEEFS